MRNSFRDSLRDLGSGLQRTDGWRSVGVPAYTQLYDTDLFHLTRHALVYKYRLFYNDNTGESCLYSPRGRAFFLQLPTRERLLQTLRNMYRGE
jgi:hypothetical protein